MKTKKVRKKLKNILNYQKLQKQNTRQHEVQLMKFSAENKYILTYASLPTAKLHNWKVI